LNPITMEPLHHEVTVACDRAAAYRLFTTGLGSWWDPAHTPDAATFTGAGVEPRVGGAVALLHGEQRSVFGEVLVWDRPAHYAQTFWLGMDPAHPTRLDVRFEEEDGVCTVVFEHGGWTEQNLAHRARSGDWSHLLGRFARAAAEPR
jgi:hypothetical protein